MIITPESVNPFELPCKLLHSVALLPPIPALYFAATSNQGILYIGITSNLQKRWLAHHKTAILSKTPDVRIHWLELQSEPSRELEREFIQYFKPLYKAWKNHDYDTDITKKIYQQQIYFKHWKTEQAVEADIERLFKLAETGCNKTLSEGYQVIHDKWLAKNNYDACDYLANAWDCISTAQCKLARRWGVYIEWSTIDEWSDD